jgi:hypothetical protein
LNADPEAFVAPKLWLAAVAAKKFAPRLTVFRVTCVDPVEPGITGVAV